MHWAVLISVLIHQAWLHQRRGWFDPFAVETLLDAALLLIVVVGTAIDPTAMALMTGNLDFGVMVWAGQLALYLGLHGGAQAGTASPSLGTGELSRRALLWVSLGYAAGVGVVLAQSAQLAGGLTNWLFGSRTDVAAAAAAGGAGAIASNVALAGQAVLMVAVATAWRKGRWVEGWSWFGAIVLGLFCIFTTRFQFIVLLLLPVVYLHYRRRRVSVGWLAAAVVPMVGLLALLNLVRGGGLAGLGQDVKVEDLVAGSSVVAPTYLLNPVVQLWEAEEQGRFDYEYGLNYLYTFVTPIPRALWPEKPLTSFSNRITEQMQGSQLDALGGINISTYTVWGEGFGQFGAAGAVLNLGLFGYVLARFLRAARRRTDWILVGAFTAILGATYLRDSVQGVLVLCLNTIGFVALVSYLDHRAQGGEA